MLSKIKIVMNNMTLSIPLSLGSKKYNKITEIIKCIKYCDVIFNVYSIVSENYKKLIILQIKDQKNLQIFCSKISSLFTT